MELSFLVNTFFEIGHDQNYLNSKAKDNKLQASNIDTNYTTKNKKELRKTEYIVIFISAVKPRNTLCNDTSKLLFNTYLSVYKLSCNCREERHWRNEKYLLTRLGGRSVFFQGALRIF